MYSLASAFIVSCPSTNPTLPVKAFPHLTLKGSTAVTSGETISVQGQWSDGTYAVILAGLMSYPVKIMDNKFMFPSDPSIKGQVISRIKVGLILGVSLSLERWEYYRRFDYFGTCNFVCELNEVFGI